MIEIKQNNKVDINTRENKKTKKNKKNLNQKILSCFLVGIVSYAFCASSINLDYEKKIHDVSVERINEGKVIQNTINNDLAFKNYIENYKYTNEMYHKDLLKLKEFDQFLLENYKIYLNKNNFKDDRSEDDILKFIKKEEAGEYFNLFRILFYNNLYKNKRINSLENLELFSYLYHIQKDPTLSRKDINNIWKEELKNNDVKLSNNYDLSSEYILRVGMAKKTEKYVIHNKEKENIVLFDRSVNKENSEGYFEKIKNKNIDREEVIKLYHEKIFEIMQNEKIMFETFKILNASNSLIDSFEGLKGSVDKSEFPAVTFFIGSLLNNVFSESEFLKEFNDMPKIIGNDNYTDEMFEFIITSEYNLKTSLFLRNFNSGQKN